MDRIIGDGKWRIGARLESLPGGNLFRAQEIQGDRILLAKELPFRPQSSLPVLAEMPPFRYLSPVEEIYVDRESTWLLFDCFGERTLQSELEFQLIPLEDGVIYALQIIAGLCELHKARIIHGALQPESCIILEDQSIRLTEFNLSFLWERSGYLNLAYSDPLSKPSDPNPERDIYSFGVILYQLSTGQLPFDIKDEFELKSRPAAIPPAVGRRASSWPNQIFKVVERCMSLDKKARYQESTQVLSELRQIALQNGVKAAVSIEEPKACRNEKTGINFLPAGKSQVNITDRILGSSFFRTAIFLGAIAAIVFGGGYNKEIHALFDKYFKSVPLTINAIELGIYHGTIGSNGSALTLERSRKGSFLSLKNCAKASIESETGYFACESDGFLSVTSISGQRIRGNIKIRGEEVAWSARRAP